MLARMHAWALLPAAAQLKAGGDTAVMEAAEPLVCGAEMTAEKRREMFGAVAGGRGAMAPEKYQRRQVERLVGAPCTKPAARIHAGRGRLVLGPVSLQGADGFEYTEDFDGVQRLGAGPVYINFKCVCGQGGSQSRTLGLVYQFVKAQLEALRADPGVRFANVLDGDAAAKRYHQFAYLLERPQHATVKNRLFVGSLRDYVKWATSGAPSAAPVRTGCASERTPSTRGKPGETGSRIRPEGD